MKGSAVTQTLFAFGLNHKTAPVEIREKLYLNEDEINALLKKFRETLSECFVVSTCNRTEVYGVSESPTIDLGYYKSLLIDVKGAEGLIEEDHFFSLISCSACQQLFNVATSIDSKVIGDSQILRQLREAYSFAMKDGHAGKILNQLLQRALKLGKATYTQTLIHDGATSVSSVAVELAIKTFGSLQGRTVLVIGAGEMAHLTTEALVDKNVGKIIVSNRTREHAEKLLSELQYDPSIDSEVLDFDEITDRLPSVDIVISSTGSNEPILYKEDFAAQTRKILVIDIAVPRDIDPAVAENPNVILRNIDDLHVIVDENHERRELDLPKVKKMVIEEMIEFLTWYYLLPIMPAYEKTGVRPSREQAYEILRIKQFLNENIAEIHRFAAASGDSFSDDLDSHFSLVQRLRSLKAEKLDRVVAV
ncbi:MAG TPA: glutamyl-tRNA reductase [Pyrinomonadaceae bacterium]|nr:glutamyl-tRNA reductase [Pyrinomonadaceae bacterium]